jgi:hypothetical protein
MPARNAVLPIAALTAALVAGCGTSSPSASGPGPAPTPQATSASCHQLYQNWRLHSGQLVIINKLQGDVTSLASAMSAQDIPLTRSAMVKLGADARQLQAYHMPDCADPQGLFPKWIAALVAVGDNAKSVNGLGSILLAVAPLKEVRALSTQMAAELHQTAGM